MLFPLCFPLLTVFEIDVKLGNCRNAHVRVVLAAVVGVHDVVVAVVDEGGGISGLESASSNADDALDFDDGAAIDDHGGGDVAG